MITIRTSRGASLSSLIAEFCTLILCSTVILFAAVACSTDSSSGDSAGDYSGGGSGKPIEKSINLEFYSDRPTTENPAVKKVSQTIKTETVLLRKNTFSKDGYVFYRWQKYLDGMILIDMMTYYDDEATIKADDFKDPPVGKYVLIAEWLESSKAQHITFNKNDGSAAPVIKRCTVNKTQDFQPISKYGTLFSREGFEFLGYDENPAASVPAYYSGGDKLTIKTDVTLYAIWKEKNPSSYAVIYYANYEGANPGTYTQYSPVDKKIIPDADAIFTRNGHAFIGWASKYLPLFSTKYYKADELIDFRYDPHGNAMSLDACWAAENDFCIVTYDANGGSGTPPPVQKFGKDSPLYFRNVAPNPFVREHYKFLGWNDSKNGTWGKWNASSDREKTKRFYFETGKKVTLYAVWEYDLPIITFVHRSPPSAATKNGEYETKQYPMSKTEPTKLAPNPFILQEVGYKFIGWKDEKTGKTYEDGASLIVTEDMTLRAQWEPITYTITFDGNGGLWGTIPLLGSAPKGDPKKSIVMEERKPPYVFRVKNVFKDPVSSTEYYLHRSSSADKPYYKFIGYSKNKDATVPDPNYEELDTVTISEKKDTTLYAVWKLVPKYGDH